MLKEDANKSLKELTKEISELRLCLEESEEALQAIRSGEVDALVLPGPNGVEVYTLKSADHAFRVLVEEMREGAVVVSEDGVILYANRCFADMLKLPSAEVIGRPLNAFAADDDRHVLESFLRRARSGSDKGEFLLRTRDAVEPNLPVYLSASSFQMDGQQAIGMVVADLTEQKRSEQLAAASRAKDHFLAMLSHELRTPLTPVLSTVYLMETDQSLSSEQRDSLSTIRRNVELEARLIDDLLDLTRISRGKVELRQEIVDAHAALKAALDISQADISSKQLEVSLGLWAEHHHVWADPARLQQICWNLVTNAVKFTSPGGKITCRSINVDGQRLQIQITDTGVGIDSETLPKLFNAFEQGNREMTRRFGGLGLGLTISKALVDMQRGTLTVTSEGKGKGATFTLEFATMPMERRQEADSQIPAICGQRECRILLVDDHQDTLKIMARLLKQLGYLVTTADGVRAAMDAAATEKFDLLISDIGLPDGSGLEIMKKVRSQYDLKRIALSGFGMDEDLRRSREAGFDEHLTKPVNLQTLGAAIRRAIADGKVFT